MIVSFRDDWFLSYFIDDFRPIKIPSVLGLRLF